MTQASDHGGAIVTAAQPAGPLTRRHVRCAACQASDPRQAPELRGRRGAVIASRLRALREWEEAHPGEVPDQERFTRDILPGLATVPLSAILAATGCSKAAASGWRRGKHTPHVSTWPALAQLGGPKSG